MVLKKGSKFKEEYHLKKCIVHFKNGQKAGQGLLCHSLSGWWYVFQNSVSGGSCPELDKFRKDYKFSWNIGNTRVFECGIVTIEIINEEENEIWF